MTSNRLTARCSKTYCFGVCKAYWLGVLKHVSTGLSCQPEITLAHKGSKLKSFCRESPGRCREPSSCITRRRVNEHRSVWHVQRLVSLVFEELWQDGLHMVESGSLRTGALQRVIHLTPAYSRFDPVAANGGISSDACSCELRQQRLILHNLQALPTRALAPLFWITSSIMSLAPVITDGSWANPLVLT